MTTTVQQVVDRVLEPTTPVIWVAPKTPDVVWQGLREGLESTGFRVYQVDAADTLDALFHSLAAAMPMPDWSRPNLNSLKDSLLGLDDGGTRGWALIFRHPERLRHNDESAFEDFLEVLELVNDIVQENNGQMFKLILPD